MLQLRAMVGCECGRGDWGWWSELWGRGRQGIAVVLVAVVDVAVVPADAAAAAAAATSSSDAPQAAALP